MKKRAGGANLPLFGAYAASEKMPCTSRRAAAYYHKPGRAERKDHWLVNSGEWLVERE